MSIEDFHEDGTPKWWQDLSPAQRAFISQLTGSNVFPNPTLEEVGRLFDETRQRIREIEERALKRIHKGDSGKPPDQPA